MILPRQARDTHRENSKKSGVSSSGRGSGRASGDDEEDAADGASRQVRGGGLTETGCETRHFLSHLYINTNFLPRQARDKHRENSKKEWRFSHQGIMELSVAQYLTEIDASMIIVDCNWNMDHDLITKNGAQRKKQTAHLSEYS